MTPTPPAGLGTTFPGVFLVALRGIPQAEPAISMHQAKLPVVATLLPPVPLYTTPLLSARLGYAPIHTAQICGAAASTPLSRSAFLGHGPSRLWHAAPLQAAAPLS